MQRNAIASRTNPAGYNCVGYQRVEALVKMYEPDFTGIAQVAAMLRFRTSYSSGYAT